MNNDGFDALQRAEVDALHRTAFTMEAVAFRRHVAQASEICGAQPTAPVKEWIMDCLDMLQWA